MEETNKWVYLFQEHWLVLLIILVAAGIMYTITEIVERRKRKKAKKEISISKKAD